MVMNLMIMTDYWLVCHKQTINLMLMCNIFMLIYCNRADHYIFAL